MGYMLATNDYINVKFDMPDAQAWFYNIYSGFLTILKFWILEKKLKIERKTRW